MEERWQKTMGRAQALSDVAILAAECGNLAGAIEAQERANQLRTQALIEKYDTVNAVAKESQANA